MTQEDKNLLLQDLCGRLPYGVKGNYQNSDDELLRKVTIMYRYLEPNGMVMTGDIKPYLFPLSSMTEEQKKELDKKFNVIAIYGNNILIHYHSQGYWDTDLEVDFQDWLWLINWLNKNHFDYRGLIEKDLAFDATGLNIY